MRVTVHGRIAFASIGGQPTDAMGPAVVFVHGAGFDHTVWVMAARYFARHGRKVFAVDLPGHGRSEGPALASVDAMADWLATFLDAVDAGSATVVGHSMGSLVAYAFAARHPARVRALVLAAISLPMPVSERLLGAAADDDHAAIDMANAWSHSARGAFGPSDVPGIWMLGAEARLLERATPGVYHTDFVACDGYRAPQAPVAAETLIIVGTADRMTPASAGAELAGRLPRARVVRLEGSGHSMLTEQPNQVLDALISIV